MTKYTHLQWLYILGGAVNQKGNCKSLLQLCHPLPRIRHFREAGIGVIPEGEEYHYVGITWRSAKLKN